MVADNTIKLNPAKTVLKYKVRDEIKLNEADFVLIFKAFFDELEKEYLRRNEETLRKIQI